MDIKQNHYVDLFYKDGGCLEAEPITVLQDVEKFFLANVTKNFSFYYNKKPHKIFTKASFAAKTSDYI